MRRDIQMHLNVSNETFIDSAEVRGLKEQLVNCTKTNKAINALLEQKEQHNEELVKLKDKLAVTIA